MKSKEIFFCKDLGSHIKIVNISFNPDGFLPLIYLIKIFSKLGFKGENEGQPKNRDINNSGNAQL